MVLSMIEYVDFPGLTGGGDTVEEALSIAQEAMALYQEVLEKERQIWHQSA